MAKKHGKRKDSKREERERSGEARPPRPRPRSEGDEPLEHVEVVLDEHRRVRVVTRRSVRIEVQDLGPEGIRVQVTDGRGDAPQREPQPTEAAPEPPPEPPPPEPPPPEPPPPGKPAHSEARIAPPEDPPGDRGATPAPPPPGSRRASRATPRNGDLPEPEPAGPRLQAPPRGPRGASPRVAPPAGAARAREPEPAPQVAARADGPPAQAPKDIFISYKSDDRDRVVEIHDRLVREGFSVWMDKEGGIGAGEDYTERISTALAQCRVLFLVGSKASFGSKWVKNEARTAYGADKRILIAMLEDAPLPEGMGVYLDVVERVNFFGREEPRAWARILESLGRWGIERGAPRAERASGPARRRRWMGITSLALLLGLLLSWYCVHVAPFLELTWLQVLVPLLAVASLPLGRVLYRAALSKTNEGLWGTLRNGYGLMLRRSVHAAFGVLVVLCTLCWSSARVQAEGESFGVEYRGRDLGRADGVKLLPHLGLPWTTVPVKVTRTLGTEPLLGSITISPFGLNVWHLPQPTAAVVRVPEQLAYSSGVVEMWRLDQGQWTPVSEVAPYEGEASFFNVTEDEPDPQAEDAEAPDVARTTVDVPRGSKVRFRFRLAPEDVQGGGTTAPPNLVWATSNDVDWVPRAAPQEVELTPEPIPRFVVHLPHYHESRLDNSRIDVLPRNRNDRGEVTLGDPIVSVDTQPGVFTMSFGCGVSASDVLAEMPGGEDLGSPTSWPHVYWRFDPDVELTARLEFRLMESKEPPEGQPFHATASGIIPVVVLTD